MVGVSTDLTPEQEEKRAAYWRASQGLAKETPQTEDASKPAIAPEVRRSLNDDAVPLGYACAVLRRKKGRGQWIVFVKLPRGSSRKAPRRGVQIPVPATTDPRLGRVGKHSRQRIKDGKFGKKGERTVAAKQEFLKQSSEDARALAVVRRIERFANRRGISIELAHHLYRGDLS